MIPAPAVSRSPTVERMMLLAILVCAALLSVKYFPGFENETDYAGNAFQTIHPDAFAGDPWRDPEKPFYLRPTQLSLLYGLIKIIGEAWLDDRFTAIVYIGLVFLSLLGIDRIAGLFGVTEPAERLVVLCLFLKDHQVIKNNVLLAHHPDVNHFAFAIPILVWLMYAALARKGLMVVLLLSALAVLVSFRNGIFPSAIALVLVAVNGDTRERVVVGALFAVGLTVAYFGLFHLYTMPDTARLEIWSNVVKYEHWAANSLHGLANDPVDILGRNAIWLAICAAALFAPGHRSAVFQDLRLVIVLGLVVWLGAALYVSFAPDAIKMPMLLSLAPARSLAVQQNLAYVAIASGLLMWIRDERSVGRVATAGAGLVALVLIGPGDLVRWSALLAVTAGVVIFARAWTHLDGEIFGGLRKALALSLVERPARLFAQVLTLAFAVVFAVATWQKAPAWRVLIQHGIYGEAASAKWLGVDRYIRENTPVRASVLPLYYSARRRTLVGDGALRTRTGRAVPVMEYYRNILDPAWWDFEEKQKNALAAAGDAFMSHDLGAAARAVERLVPVPDYIVLPTGRLNGLDETAFPYARENEIGGFTVLQRTRPKPESKLGNQ